MKKLITISLFLICSFFAKGQYGIPQNLGGPNTLVQNPNYGGFRGGLIPYTFTDTTQANSLATALKTYNGAIIYSTSDNALFWRDATNLKWVQVLPSGSPTGLGAWTTTLNTAIPTDISLNGYFGTTAANGIGFYTSNTQRVILPSTGLLFNQIVSDTTLNKPMTYNTSTKQWGYGYWYSGGAATTPTWQQTLVAGSTLNQNNTIIGGGNDFTFGGVGTYIINNAQGSEFKLESDFTRIIGKNASNGRLSEVVSSGDYLSINPTEGVLIIDTINNETFTNTVMAWTTTSGANRGKVGYLTLGTGGSISSGVLSFTGTGANTALSNLTSPTAFNQHLIPGTNNTFDIGTSSSAVRTAYFGTSVAIGTGFSPSAALDIRAQDVFITSNSFDQRILLGEGVVSATDHYIIGWERSSNTALFNYSASATPARFQGDNNANLMYIDAANDRIGIGDATPASLFTVGSGDLFQVNTSGDMVKIKNVTYSWPAANAAGALTNDGSGNLSYVGYMALSGTSTLGASVVIDATSNDLAIQGTRSGINILNRETQLGDYSVSGNGTRIRIDEANDKLFMISAAITGATTGDALTVADPTTGEIGVAPNLAFNFMKENTMIYAKNGRLFAEDADKNITQISPHDSEGNWIYRSTNKDGVTTEINMIRLAELLEKVTGEKLIYKTKN